MIAGTQALSWMVLFPVLALFGCTTSTFVEAAPYANGAGTNDKNARKTVTTGPSNMPIRVSHKSSSSYSSENPSGRPHQVHPRKLCRAGPMSVFRLPLTRLFATSQAKIAEDRHEEMTCEQSPIIICLTATGFVIHRGKKNCETWCGGFPRRRHLVNTVASQSVIFTSTSASSAIR